MPKATEPVCCPIHSAHRMRLDSKIRVKTCKGKPRWKIIGHRFRCPIPGCPRCETTANLDREVTYLRQRK